MRFVLLVLAVLATVLAASCVSGGVPSSSIYLVERDTNRIMSTSRNRGELTLEVGETVFFMVERLTSEGDDTNTADVTTVSSFHFIPVGIASATTLGELTALAPGTTQLEARFRPDSLSSADRVYLDITVVAPAE